MATNNNNEQQIYNLASRMEFILSINVADVKAVVASKSQKFEVNARNKHGKTALMYACGRADMEMIKFLLEQGADPNLQCNRGNTAMHHAVGDDFCYCVRNGNCRYQFQYFDEQPIYGNTITERRLDIIRLLISHGATLKYNSSGQNPVCLAALHQRTGIVDFFVKGHEGSLKLSEAEIVRALQTLGVATALESLHTYEKDNIINSYVHFYKAQSILEKVGSSCLGESKKSDVASAFSLFSEKEYNCEEWKNIQNDDWAIKAQAFLIAERVIPEDIKEDYLFMRLLFHARICIFQFGNMEDRLLQGTQISKEALQLELTPKLEPSSVLRNLLHGFHMISWQSPEVLDKVNVCFPVMESCLHVLDKASGCSVHKVHKKVLYNLGALLIRLAISDCSKTMEVYESLLQFAERLIPVIRRKCEGRRVTSITHFILHKESEELNIFRKKRERLTRAKQLISRLVQLEDASHRSAQGNTMLHSLMISCACADLQFLKDVALILVRNGCDARAVNDYDHTAEYILRFGRDGQHPKESPYWEELLEIVSPPEGVLSLEEIVVRAVLRQKIPHEGRVPRHLSSIIKGEHGQDETLQADTEVRSDDKIHLDVEVRSDGKLQADTEVRSDEKPQADTEVRSDKKPQADTEVRSDDKLHLDHVDAEVRSDEELQADTKVRSDEKLQADTEVRSDDKLHLDAEVWSDEELQADIEDWSDEDWSDEKLKSDAEHSPHKIKESHLESDVDSSLEEGPSPFRDSSEFSDDLYSSYESSTDFSDYNGLDKSDTPSESEL